MNEQNSYLIQVQKMDSAVEEGEILLFSLTTQAIGLFLSFQAL